jgi:hypothetical protein
MNCRNHGLRRKYKAGFTLVEAVVAIFILATGILAIVDVATQGLKISTATQYDYIAKKKAEQAIEAIFTARNVQEESWDDIQNISKGGIFKDGPQNLYAPGKDGLVGTNNDDTTHPDVLTTGPGPDGIFGTADDIVVPLPGMTREIQITTPLDAFGNPIPNLREITVIMRYTVTGVSKTQTFVSYISPFA